MSFSNDLRKELGGKDVSDTVPSYPSIGKDVSGKLDSELGHDGDGTLGEGLGAKGNPFLAKEMNRESHVQNQHILKNSENAANGAAENKVTRPRPV